jgi:hypothetical protein
MHSESLAALVSNLGIPATAGRACAIRQHVLEMPAPIVAEALGYHRATRPNSPPNPEAPGAGTPRGPLTSSPGRAQHEFTTVE